jgi:hypothetical protein
VVAKLCFYRPLHRIDGRAEYHSIELLDHLPWAKGAQIAAVTSGWATGVVARDLGKIGASLNNRLQFNALGFSGMAIGKDSI